MTADLREALPPHLAERVHVPEPSSGRHDRAGRYVVYWMRTAVRDHDNPALDAAMLAAESRASRYLA